MERVKDGMKQHTAPLMPEGAKQGADTHERGSAEGNRWAWVEASVWTERMVSALDNGVKGSKNTMPSSRKQACLPCTRPGLKRDTPDEGNYRLESRMRENRTYGSEGGEGESPSLPLCASVRTLCLRGGSPRHWEVTPM